MKGPEAGQKVLKTPGVRKNPLLRSSAPFRAEYTLYEAIVHDPQLIEVHRIGKHGPDGPPVGASIGLGEYYVEDVYLSMGEDGSTLRNAFVQLSADGGSGMKVKTHTFQERLENYEVERYSAKQLGSRQKGAHLALLKNANKQEYQRATLELLEKKKERDQLEGSLTLKKRIEFLDDVISVYRSWFKRNGVRVRRVPTVPVERKRWTRRIGELGGEIAEAYHRDQLLPPPQRCYKSLQHAVKMYCRDYKLPRGWTLNKIHQNARKSRSGRL